MKKLRAVLPEWVVSKRTVADVPEQAPLGDVWRLDGFNAPGVKISRSMYAWTQGN